MLKYYLSNKAKADLRSIGRYTQKQWGKEQRNHYLRNLDKCIQHLAERPALGITCDEIRQGYRKYSEGKHVIFYKVLGNEIEIIRILHKSMDYQQHI